MWLSEGLKSCKNDYLKEREYFFLGVIYQYDTIWNVEIAIIKVILIKFSTIFRLASIWFPGDSD